MNRKSILRSILPIALVALAAPAFAGDTTADLNIQGTLNNSCYLFVSSVTDLDWSGTSSNSTVNSSLSITCNQGTTYSISPGQGQNFGALAGYEGYRAVTNGAGAFIPYGLFKDIPGTQVWGDGVDAFAGTGNGEVQTHEFAVKFLALKQAVGGNYTDTVTITATYN